MKDLQLKEGLSFFLKINHENLNFLHKQLISA